MPASTATVGGPHPQRSQPLEQLVLIAEFCSRGGGLQRWHADKDAFLVAQRQALAAFDDTTLARALQASGNNYRRREETKRRRPYSTER